MNIKTLDSKVYAIMQREYEYNDEYSYPEGCHPVGYVRDLSQAKQWCESRNKKLCLGNDWRTQSNVAYDGTYEQRWELWGQITGENITPDPYDVDSYKIDWPQMIAYVEENNLSLADYLPDVYYVEPMELIS